MDLRFKLVNYDLPAPLLFFNLHSAISITCQYLYPDFSEASTISFLFFKRYSIHFLLSCDISPVISGIFNGTFIRSIILILNFLQNSENTSVFEILEKLMIRLADGFISFSDLLNISPYKNKPSNGLSGLSLGRGM